MYLASLLVLMTLLLPQALPGHQVNSSFSDGNPVAPLEPSLALTIQNLLLTRLGLESHPRPRTEAIVPQYLLDLYRFHTQDYHLIEDPDFSYPTKHIQGANTVRTFHHAGKYNIADVCKALLNIWLLICQINSPNLLHTYIGLYEVSGTQISLTLGNKGGFQEQMEYFKLGGK